MPRLNKNTHYPVMKTVYLTEPTDEAVTTMAELLGIGWATLVRAVLDEFVNRARESAEDVVLVSLNQDLKKGEF